MAKSVFAGYVNIIIATTFLKCVHPFQESWLIKLVRQAIRASAAYCNNDFSNRYRLFGGSSKSHLYAQSFEKWDHLFEHQTGRGSKRCSRRTAN